MEPDWGEVSLCLGKLTLKQLAPIKWWFKGCLGGESTKAAVVHEMITQMQYWWRSCDEGGRRRVKNVLEELRLVEERPL